jgi:ribosomal protein S18 acetylase RimI-like enzyme
MLGLMADEWIALLVAQIEELVVGFVHVKLWDMPSISILVPRRVAMIDNLAVSEGVRRKGVGRALMERASGDNLRPDQ